MRSIIATQQQHKSPKTTTPANTLANALAAAEEPSPLPCREHSGGLSALQMEQRWARVLTRELVHRKRLAQRTQLAPSGQQPGVAALQQTPAIPLKPARQSLRWQQSRQPVETSSRPC